MHFLHLQKDVRRQRKMQGLVLTSDVSDYIIWPSLLKYFVCVLHLKEQFTQI